MFKFKYFVVVHRIKNLPFKPGDFLQGYKLGNQDTLGGYTVGKTRVKELIKAGDIKRISKAELTRILIGRHTIG